MTSLRAVEVVRRLCREQGGQDLLEYALLVALIALAAAGAVETVGSTITGVFWDFIAGNPLIS